MDKGKKNEKRMLRILRNRKLRVLFPWFTGVEPANLEQDGMGIDVVVHTTEGTKYLQIKSSSKEAQRFRAKYPKQDRKKQIAVVTVRDHFDDYTLCKQAMYLINEMVTKPKTLIVKLPDDNSWENFEIYKKVNKC